jgi:hypothetical protein
MDEYKKEQKKSPNTITENREHGYHADSSSMIASGILL